MSTDDVKIKQKWKNKEKQLLRRTRETLESKFCRIDFIKGGYGDIIGIVVGNGLAYTSPNIKLSCLNFSWYS